MNRILKKSDNIYLYGEAAYTDAIKDALNRNGYNIEGQIDKKYIGTHHKENILKLSIDAYFEEYKKSDDVIIVCIGDTSKHDEIAEYLFDKGVNWIIYISMSISVSIEYRRLLRKAYAELLDLAGQDVIIPQYQKDKRQKVVVIREGYDCISFWCPVKYLYTHNIYEWYPQFKEYIKGLDNGDIWEKYINVPITEMTPYIDLFRNLAGEGINDDTYFRMNRNNQNEKIELKENRRKLFEIFEYSYIYDKGFFTEGPARVIWNTCGWFNIFDGLHRASYLVWKDCECIPVMASKTDYEMFINSISDNEFLMV